MPDTSDPADGNRVESALDTLLDAEFQAPEQVRYHRLSRILVRKCWLGSHGLGSLPISAGEGVDVCSILLVSRPYQQRRAFATCKKLCPEVEVRCGSRPLSLDEYIENIGDTKRVVNMLVGDTQRITEYAKRGFAIEQEMPPQVQVACQQLIDAGFTDRLI